MTPRHGQRKAAQWEAAFVLIGAELERIVEREQQKGVSEDERDHNKPAVSKP
jgi:uncharacterized protein YpmB